MENRQERYLELVNTPEVDTPKTNVSKVAVYLEDIVNLKGLEPLNRCLQSPMNPLPIMPCHG